MQQSNIIHRFLTLNHKLQYKVTLMYLFMFGQATTVYSLPGHNHAVIQGEYSNDSFLQFKYVKTIICNTNDSISIILNISNPFTADDA